MNTSVDNTSGFYFEHNSDQTLAMCCLSISLNRYTFIAKIHQSHVTWEIKIEPRTRSCAINEDLGNIEGVPDGG